MQAACMLAVECAARRVVILVQRCFYRQHEHSQLTVGTHEHPTAHQTCVCHATVYLAVLRLLPHLLRLSTSLAGRLPAAVAGTSCGVLVALQRRMRCPQQQQGELT